VHDAAEAEAAAVAHDPTLLEHVQPVPTLRSLLARERTRVVWDGAVPIVLFIAANTAGGLVAAIVVTTLYSLGLTFYRSRRGQRANWIMWIVIGLIALRGVISALFHSKLLYFGPQLLNEALIALAFFGSVLVGRPLCAYIGQWIYPFQSVIKEHPAFRKVFNRITLAWAGYLAVGVVVKALLLVHTSSNTYVLVRPLISWPPMIALFVFSLRYPRIAFKRVPELAPYIEHAEALRARRS
jgi:uncharacterized membrane protein